MAISKTRLSVPVSEIRLASKPTTSFDALVKDLRTALGKLGCEGCRSGLDRIILEDAIRRRF